MKKIILLSTIFCILLLPWASFSRDIKDLPTSPRFQGITILGKRSGDVMEGMRLEPFNKISVNRFTRVYWTNQSDTPIRIKFLKGEKCRDISKTPQEAQDWWDNVCRITKEPIPPNGILQVYFNEQGLYDYEIQFVGTKSTFKDRLVVY